MARGLADDTKHAQALILSGRVFSNERRIDKPGTIIPNDMPIEVRGADHPWVSRGGLKLDYALDSFCISVDGATVIDVGSSTGRFYSVVLSRGASRVYAVDVGVRSIALEVKTGPKSDGT